MRSEWFCTYLNKPQFEYDIIKRFYINEDSKIQKLTEDSHSKNNNKIYNNFKYLNKLKINEYGILNNHIDFLKNIQNIKFEGEHYKNLGLNKHASIEEVE